MPRSRLHTVVLIFIAFVSVRFARLMSFDPKLSQRLVVHELPSAPKFIGRELELESLREFWQGNDNVISLIGLGGAGKTALADRFLTWAEEDDAPDWLMVWSFYYDPDANAFMEALYRFLTGDETSEVKGSGWFHLLREQLAGSRKGLLVLDGLERVQRPITDATGIFGELEDPLLRGLLTRLATSGGNTKAVITSRFPVSTIEPYLGKGYRVLDVAQLPPEAAKALLAARGIEMSDDQVAKFVGTYGSHALTLDLLAGAVAEFFDGKVSKLPGKPESAEPSHRLGYVLKLYELNLPTQSRELLSRLCVFRFGVDAKTLNRVFIQSQNSQIAGSLADLPVEMLDKLIDALVARHLVYRESHQKYTVHPAVRDHFYRLFRDPQLVHGAIAQHFSTLTERPGIGLPGDKESLDLLEELIHHAIQARSVREAAEIYFSRLGGNDHLNGTLGEYARTYRILTAFPECPDPSGMYHCERAFGNFEMALQWRPQNRYIRLVMGNLAALSEDASETTRTMASALMRRDSPIPERSPDMPICSAMAAIFRHDVEASKRLAQMEISISIYEDDRVRNQLALAEYYRRTNRLNLAHEEVEKASQWILQSASQEHLCCLHFVRAHIALDERNLDVARFAIAEGLEVSREAGFRLYECLFLIARSQEHETRGELVEALACAESARGIAAECHFEYGISASIQLATRLAA